MIDRVHRAHATGAQTSFNPKAGEDLPPAGASCP